MEINFILNIVFIIFSIIIAVIDYKTGRVPRIAFLLILPVFFMLRLVFDTSGTFLLSVIGALMGLAIFLLIFFISGKKLGLADVWYSGIIGFVLGPVWWYAGIITACFLGIMYIVLFKKKEIPFIPFMAIGGVAACVIEGRIQ